MTLADVKPAARPGRRPAPPADKTLEPGSVGWTADEVLSDPWVNDFIARRYELINGVIATIPALPLFGTDALGVLIAAISVAAHDAYGEERFLVGPEAHMLLHNGQVVIADAVFLDPPTLARYVVEASRRYPKRPRAAPCLVPPTIVIEAVSEGHESHDRVEKRAWYAEWGVPHYWLLDGPARRLDCLKLDPAAGDYVEDVSGEGDAELRPSLPFELVIPLGRLWPKVM